MLSLKTSRIKPELSMVIECSNLNFRGLVSSLNLSCEILADQNLISPVIGQNLQEKA